MMKPLFKSFLLTMIIVGVVGTTIYNFSKIVKLESGKEKLNQEIKDLKHENVNLKYALNRKDQMLKSYEKRNRELALQIKNKKEKQPLKNQNKKSEHVQKNNTASNNQKLLQKLNQKPKEQNNNKKYKRYDSYSSNMQLVSDSKITKDKYNKLHSNAPIYGRYKTSNAHMHKIYGEKCDNIKNRYNVVDECRVKTIDGDTIYTTKMRIKSLKNYYTGRYMIECKYSKEYGIMHDCMVKLKS